MATLLEYARLAEVVYQTYPATVAGWSCPSRRLAVDATPFWLLGNPFRSGFQGRVFQRAGEVVFAFKGTDPSMFNDLYSDIVLALHSQDLRSRASAIPIRLGQAEDALGAVVAWSREFAGVRQSIVGHSLGGFLAQLAGSATGIPFVTFQAPGARRFPFPPATMRSHGPVRGVNVRVSTGLVTHAGVPIGTVRNLPGGPDSHAISQTVRFLEGPGRKYAGERPLGW